MKDDVLGQVVSPIVTCLVSTLLSRYDKDKRNEIVDLSRVEIKIHKNDGTIISVKKRKEKTK